MTQTLHSPSWSEPDQPSSAVSPFKRFAALPEAAGLYNPEHEKDACGLAIIATLRGEPGYDIVDSRTDRPAQPRTPRCRRRR